MILRRGHAQGSEKKALKPDWYSGTSPTSVCQYGLAPPTKPRGSSQCNQPRAMAVRNLTGKEGSEVTVTWKDEAGAKMATAVNVTQLFSRKSSQRKGSWQKK